MSGKDLKEEYIEILWNMFEVDDKDINSLKKKLGDDFSDEPLKQLEEEGTIIRNREQGRVELSESGRVFARKLIRAHRIGERLIHDVLGGDFEVGACELEHIMNIGLVDSICTLLGHPRECPHGKPIPEGDCCRSAETIAYSSVISLTEMEVGQTAKVAYVCSVRDQQLHIIDSLQIKPGVSITLHQKRPSYVIKCEGAHIALDEEVASNIRLWKDTCAGQPSRVIPPQRGGRHRGRFFRGKGRKHRPR